MTESIVVIRLTRNLRYKLTYVKIFEDYLGSEREAEVGELFRSLLQAYQEAIGPLAAYLRRLGVAVQDLELDDKLLSHAAGRRDTESQLRFVYDGLRRAASWYRTQLLDRQMSGDPELRELLLNLGEIDAAKLWRTETLMSGLRIAVRTRDSDYPEPAPAPELPPRGGEDWRPRLIEDVRRPNWSGTSRPPTDRGRPQNDRGRPARPPSRGPRRDER